MDPQVNSLLTTIVGYVATGCATWATGVGIVPGVDKASLVNIITAVILWAIAAGIAEYKRRTQTQPALIAAVNNSDNGVKVVAKTAQAIQVDAPLK